MFRPKPGGGSMDAKWFWIRPDSAVNFSKVYDDLNYIVEVKVPKSVLNVASSRETNLDRLGPAVSYIDEALSEFNNAIITIRDALIR